jgi:hypothetical protein
MNKKLVGFAILCIVLIAMSGIADSGTVTYHATIVATFWTTINTGFFFDVNEQRTAGFCFLNEVVNLTVNLSWRLHTHLKCILQVILSDMTINGVRYVVMSYSETILLADGQIWQQKICVQPQNLSTYFEGI